MLIAETEIIVRKDGAEILRRAVSSGEYVLGRERGCDVVIEVDLVSRRHARLRVEDDELLIADLDSRNGTFIDGQPVKTWSRLLPEQKIQIGAATVEVRRIASVRPSESSITAPIRAPGADLLREKRYDVGKVVAQGGMGAILDVRDPSIARNVAMKVMLRKGSEVDATRFVQEAMITGQLEHPNIVPIYELATDEHGEPYYTMKLVRGVTLRQVLDRLIERDRATVTKYPLAALLTDFQKVCDALAFAHSRRVIHRDLKPDNIMLGDFGEVLVMDWGLAKKLKSGTGGAGDKSRQAAPPSSIANNAPGLLATMEGAVMGTPQYMSPEQARGEVDTLDPRSDIYALGAILFHVLTLRLPVTGRSSSEIIARVSVGEMEALGTAGGPHLPGGRIPDSLAAVVHKAMAFERAARYASIEELQAELTAYQTGFATRAENAGAWKQLQLLIRRHRISSAAIGLSLLLIAGVTALYATNLIAARTKAEQAQARAEAALAAARQSQAEALAQKLAAEKSSAVAIEARNAADQTLEELRKTAPAIFDGARGLMRADKFAEAITRVDAAIAIEPGKAEYQLFKAETWQTMEKLAEAADLFGKVLKRPTDEATRRSAETNRQLCEEILRENGPGPLREASITKLAKALEQQGRESEANWLKSKGAQGAEQAEALIRKQLSGPLGKLPGFAWTDRLKLLPDNTFFLNLGNLVLTQVPNLQGLAISELHLGGSRITSLEPLRGLALRRLWLGGTAVADLRPLTGLPLVELDVSATGVTDFTALRGMPLRILYAARNRQLTDLVSLSRLPQLERLDLEKSGCADARPLAGLPGLRVLWLSDTRIADLSALRGLPLEELQVEGIAIRDADLKTICTLPLRRLSLRRCPGIRSLEPLAQCRTLEKLALPAGHTNLLAVRMLPNLQRLSDNPAGPLDFSTISVQTDFWKMHSFSAEEMEPMNRAVEVLTERQGRRPTWETTLDGKIAFDLQGREKNSVEPLRNLPIASLNAYGAPISDFSPLATTPIQILALGGPQHVRSRDRAAGPGEDFRSLARLSTLRHLYICHTDLKSLEPLVGLPLESLLIQGTQVTDISPLLRIPTLRLVVLPRTVTNTALLRSHPGLSAGFISYGEEKPTNDARYPFHRDYLSPASLFWKEFKSPSR